MNECHKYVMVKARDKNHNTQNSRVVPNVALRLTAQIGRNAVLWKSYGRESILSI